MSRVELMVDCQAIIGESPTWFAPRKSLFWVDVRKPCLYELDANGKTRQWPVDSDVGAFALLEQGGAALVALRTGVFRLDFASGNTSRVATAPFDPNLFRFNEGSCDTRGRFWMGMMFDPLPAYRSQHRAKAPLHQFTFTDGLVAATDESELHNGFAWDSASHTFFVSHTHSRRIYRIAYDLATGTMGRAQPFVTLSGGTGVPDGAAMDEENGYWCAVHGSAALHRYDPAGKLLSQITLPVTQPTMCAFVGPNLDEMVVTSARENLNDEQLAREPHAGGVFHLKPGVRGLARPCVVH